MVRSRIIEASAIALMVPSVPAEPTDVAGRYRYQEPEITLAARKRH
jgi:hypothetical protein